MSACRREPDACIRGAYDGVCRRQTVVAIDKRAKRPARSEVRFTKFGQGLSDVTGIQRLERIISKFATPMFQAGKS